MARQIDIEADLTLELNGSGITPSVFRRGVNAFVGLLEVLTGSVCAPSPPVEWQMQVKAGSNLIGALAVQDSDQSKVRGVRELAERCLRTSSMGSADVMAYPEKARKYVRELAKLSIPASTEIGLWVGKERHNVEPRLARSMQSAPARGIVLPGTVEGHLLALHDRGTIYFELREYVREDSIKCVVQGDLVEKSKGLWRKRVTVHGIIHYDRDGLALRVDVQDIVPLPPDDELPSYRDVRGILRKYK